MQEQSELSDPQSELLRSIRREFPRADKDANGRKRVFFENGAGSLVLQRSADAHSRAMLDYAPNVASPSWESKKDEETVLEGRKAVQDFLNAPTETTIVSGESATSLIFHLSYALGKKMTGKENIVLTEYEHYANISAWTELKKRGLVSDVRFIKFNPEDGSLDTSDAEKLIDQNTKVVAVAGIANTLGSKTPLTKIIKLARDVGSYTVIDAVHMAPHSPIDVQRIDCDFLVFSAYKVFTRRGSFMYGKKELLDELDPFRVEAFCAPNYPPKKWEPGSRDQALFAAFTAVVDYLVWLGTKVENETAENLAGYMGRSRYVKAALYWIEKYEQSLSAAMLEGTPTAKGMNSINGVQVYGMKDKTKVNLRSPTFCFNLKGIEPEKVANYMWDKHSIALLVEDFYSDATLKYGARLSTRASLVHYNTVAEVELFLKGLEDASNELMP